MIKILQKGVYVLFVLAMMTFAFSSYGALIAGKQFVYELSLMPYDRAYEVVQEQYVVNMYMMEVDGFYMSPEAIDNILRGYLENAEGLTAMENVILSQRGNIRVIKNVLAPAVIVLACVCELSGRG